MSDIVVVYYSRTGKTRLVAEKLAALLAADIEEILEAKDRGGAMGFMGGVKDALFKKSAELTSTHGLEGKTTVVIGMPVWAGHVPPAVRSYIAEADLAGKKVFGFCTHDGGGGKGLFKDMNNIVTGGVIDTFQWKKPKEGDAELDAAIADFAEKIRG